MKKFKSLNIIFACLLLTSCIFINGCKQILVEQHEHNYSTETIQPSENSMGYNKHICSCGDEYKDNYTCLLSFSSMAEGDNLDNLPVLQNQIVYLNDNFEGVNDTTRYEVMEYRIYSSDSDYTNLYTGYNIDNSMNISVVWKQKSEPTEIDTEFAELLSKIKKLEEISYQYNIDRHSTRDPQVRAMQYIRQVRYNSNAWILIAGNLENDFAQYVADHQGTMDLASLQTYQNLTIPKTGEEVDFVHMISIMNVAGTSSVTNHMLNDLCGWLGDICQLAGQINAYQLNQSEIPNKCAELFASTQNSSFGLYDLIADLDAINIMQIYETLEDKSISSIIEQYYKSVNNVDRKSNFISTIFNGNTNKQELFDESIKRIKDNPLMVMWCKTEGLNIEDEYDMAIINELIDLFLDYILA